MHDRGGGSADTGVLYIVNPGASYASIYMVNYIHYLKTVSYYQTKRLSDVGGVGMPDFILPPLCDGRYQTC